MQLDQNGIRKAAVFLSGLDWDTASDLLKRLSNDEARAVRREMVSLSQPSSEEMNSTLSQFLNQNPRNHVNDSSGNKTTHHDRTTATSVPHKQVLSRDGVDLFELSGTVQRHHEPHTNASLSNQTTHDQQTQQTQQTQDADKTVLKTVVSEKEEPLRRFAYLQKMSPLVTAEFLAEEGEQLIAVVLSQLTARYSGDVLACFEQSLKMEIIRRLAKLDNTDEIILDEIDTMLKYRLEREQEQMTTQKPGLALLEQILQVVDNEISRDILSELNEMYADDHDETKKMSDNEYYFDDHNVPLMTFEHLTLLENHELGTLFRMQNHEIAIKSLIDCDKIFVDRVLAQYPIYEQLMLRDLLQQLSEVPHEEYVYAQQCVLQGAAQLIEQGVINDIPTDVVPQFIAARPTVFDYVA